MDPLIILGIFLLGAACGAIWGHIKAHAVVEPVLNELRRRVLEAEETVIELERQEGPHIEARMLERMYRK
jgi:hypothetical protein